jgi:hypothetical protein
MSNLSAISWREQVTFDEMIRMSVCSRPTPLVGFFSASSLKQQFACKHVASLGHSILIPNQPVFGLPS